MGRNIVLSAVCAMGMLAGAAGVRADISDTFSADNGGWTHIGDSTAAPTFNATGGNPGGYITITDNAQGTGDFFVAPAKYLGNQSASFGQTFSWDILLSNDSDGANADLALIGGGKEIDYVFPVANLPKAGSWIHTTVTLSAGDPNWHLSGTSTPAPTNADFTTVLSNLTAIDILGDYRAGTETDGLDNVVMVSAVATPEPGSLGLLGIGAAAFLARRRRSCAAA